MSDQTESTEIRVAAADLLASFGYHGSVVVDELVVALVSGEKALIESASFALSSIAEDVAAEKGPFESPSLTAAGILTPEFARAAEVLAKLIASSEYDQIGWIEEALEEIGIPDGLEGAVVYGSLRERAFGFMTWVPERLAGRLVHDESAAHALESALRDWLQRCKGVDSDAADFSMQIWIPVCSRFPDSDRFGPILRAIEQSPRVSSTTQEAARKALSQLRPEVNRGSPDRS